MNAPPIRALLPLAIALLFTACGEDDTVLPEVPEERQIEGTAISPRTESDPTPETSTGGRIPGYEPAEPSGQEQGEAGED